MKFLIGLFLWCALNSCTHSPARESHQTDIDRSVLLQEAQTKIQATSDEKEYFVLRKEFGLEIARLSFYISLVSDYYFGEPFVKGVLSSDGRRSIYVDTKNNIVIPMGFLDTFSVANGFDQLDYAYIVCHEFAHILRGDWSRNVRRSSLGRLAKKYKPTLLFSIIPVLFTRKGATRTEVSASLNVPIGDYSVATQPIEVNDLSIYKFKASIETEADLDSVSCLDAIGWQHDPSVTLNKLYIMNSRKQITDGPSLLRRIEALREK